MAPSSSAFSHLDRRRGHYLPKLSSASASRSIWAPSLSADTSTEEGSPLQVLDPRPDQTQIMYQDFPRSRFSKAASVAAGTAASTESRPSSSSSYGMTSSRQGHRSMFSAPPPPIAPSVILPTGPPSPQSDQMRLSYFNSNAPGSMTRLFGRRQRTAAHAPDSGWSALRKRRQGLEKEIQELLDIQAAALAAGSMGGTDSGPTSDDGTSSHAGSAPHMDFPQSPTSPPSRMSKSLYVPPQSTPQGDVIPIRQPAAPRIGIREARDRIRLSMSFLSDVGQQEIAYMDAALADRKEALAHLTKLAARESSIDKELEELENPEEPLGKEMRELEAEHSYLDGEIQALEEKLMDMRSRRRSVRETMKQVKSQRESGLSGYRGALRDVKTRISAILRQPPVQPLNMDLLEHGGDEDAESITLDGMEFIQLLPERRTVVMAQSWWEAEIKALGSRREQVAAEQQALKDGRMIWQDVVTLVNDFEANLRRSIKRATSTRAEPSTSATGSKMKASEADMLRAQMAKVEEVIDQLEHQLQFVESQRWTLLICAIGAELDVFKQAHHELGNMLDEEEHSGDGDLLGSSVANHLSPKSSEERST